MLLGHVPKPKQKLSKARKSKNLLSRVSNCVSNWSIAPNTQTLRRLCAGCAQAARQRRQLHQLCQQQVFGRQLV